MAKVFITGSADGLGKMAAQLLVKEGHDVVMHARNADRAKVTLAAVPGASQVVVGDLSSLDDTKSVAEQVNALGRFDAVIHNAGVGYREPGKKITPQGLPHVFAINTLAPYVLTCLIQKPQRLIYLSSGLNKQGNADLSDLLWERKPWNGFQAYSDSKLHDLMLALAIADRWKDVFSNAVEPGWVATKMGGSGAPDSLEEAPVTQAWLAVSNDKEAKVSGKYFFHKKQISYNSAADDKQRQQDLLDACEKLSGIPLPY